MYCTYEFKYTDLLNSVFQSMYFFTIECFPLWSISKNETKRRNKKENRKEGRKKGRKERRKKVKRGEEGRRQKQGKGERIVKLKQNRTSYFSFILFIRIYQTLIQEDKLREISPVKFMV